MLFSEASFEAGVAVAMGMARAHRSLAFLPTLWRPVDLGSSAVGASSRRNHPMTGSPTGLCRALGL